MIDQNRHLFGLCASTDMVDLCLTATSVKRNVSDSKRVYFKDKLSVLYKMINKKHLEFFKRCEL